MNLRFLVCEAWIHIRAVCKTGRYVVVPFLAFIRDTEVIPITREQLEEEVNRLIIRTEKLRYLRDSLICSDCIAFFVIVFPTSVACLCPCQPILSIVHSTLTTMHSFFFRIQEVSYLNLLKTQR